MPPEVAAGVVEQPHLDGGPTAHPELEAEEVRRLAVRGVGALILRSLGQRGLQMIGNVLLARWLAPTTFGVYAIVSFVVGMAGFLSDLGLGASLIQRKQRLAERDLRSAFTLSLLLNLTVVAAVIALAEPLVRAYDLAGSHATSVRLLGVSILLSTFTVIPTVRLERELRFKELSFADLAGQIAYLAVTVPLAFRYRAPSIGEANADAAVWCFVWGTLASRVVNTAVINVASRWRPRLGWDRRCVREIVSFGVPYQLNGLVNALKDNFIPTFVAFAAGARAVGYVTWAVGLVTNALFLLPIVSRVTFPAYARMQDDPAALRRSIEKSIKWVAATVFPATLLLAALARQIVEHVYGPKWAPGLPSFYLLCVPMLNAAYSTVIVSALYALGRARVVLRLTLIWAVAGWVLGVPMTLAIGEHGFAAAMSIVSWLSVLSVRELNKIVRVRFVPALVRVFVLAAVPAAGVAAVARHVVHDTPSLLGLAAVGGLGYLFMLIAAGELRELRALIRRPAAAPKAEASQVVVEHA